MLKIIFLFALLFIVPATSSAQVVKELVGKYQMEVQGGDVLELRADGTAAMAGEETTWSAKDNRLSVGPDVMQYALRGDRLLLTMGSVELSWKKIGTAGKGASATKKNTARSRDKQEGIREGQPEKATRGASKSKTPAAGGNAQDSEARQLLTRTAWCSFTYNKVSGTSTTRKVIFRPDGVMTVNGGAESYSSGYGGSYAGQSNSANVMLWKLENLRLFLDQGDGSGFQDIGLNATKNSNGYVILHAGGREYSMCN